MCFDTCKLLFVYLVAGFHDVVDEVLMVEGLLEVPIYAREVAVLDLRDVIQLTSDATGQLCLMSCRGVACVLHIGSSPLEQPCIDYVLVLEFMDLCEGRFCSLL